MSDLVFTTRGQAEMLAAQEAVRKKALETKQELDEAAKATGAWDAATMKLKSSAESALRSVNTEQEKILDKIAKIQQAQEKGLVAPKEAEESVKRLRQQWIDVDEATLKAKESTENAAKITRDLATEHLRLKSVAESALRSIQTEEERIEEQIEDIEAAMFQGLIPPAEAEEGIEKLNKKLLEVRSGTDETSAAGDKLAAVFKKAFDPTEVAKFALGFVGIKALIGQVREEFLDLQDAIDKRIEQGLKPTEKGDELSKALKEAEDERKKAEDRVKEAEAKLTLAQAADSKSTAEATQQRRDEIAALDLELARAREDKKRAEDDLAERVQEAFEQRTKVLQGEKGGKVDQESLAQANKKLAELSAEKIPVGIERRISDLERQLARKAIDPITGSDATGGARSALGQAHGDLFSAERKAIEAREAYDAFTQSPEAKRADYLAFRKKALEDAYKDIAGSKSVEGYSKEELELVNKISQQVGDGATRRMVEDLLKRLDDGVVTDGEIIEQFRAKAQSLRQPTAIQQQGALGYDGPLYVEASAEDKADSQRLQRLVELMEEMNRHARDGGLFGEAL